MGDAGRLGELLKEGHEKTGTPLKRAGKRRPIGEWVKANHGSISSLLRESTDVFTVRGNLVALAGAEDAPTDKEATVASPPAAGEEQHVQFDLSLRDDDAADEENGSDMDDEL